MLKDVLDALVVQANRAHRPVQPPCQEAGLRVLKARVQEVFGLDLPGGYLALLRYTDGFEWNGLYVFGSRKARKPVSDRLNRDVFVEGIVEQNLTIRMDRPWFEDRLVFAEDGGYFYTQEISTGRFAVFLTTDDREPVSTYDTFEELMEQAIRRSLVE